MKEKITTDQVRGFWDRNPVCAWEIPHDRGSKEFFDYFDRMRERVEPADFSNDFYQFKKFAGKKVLEVGCGNGWVLNQFALAGAHVDGVDVTPTAVQLCKQRFHWRNLPGLFQVADAENLPFPDNYFDAVFSMGVLHHVPHPEKAVQEIHRVLKPGGTFGLMMYHRNSILYRVKFPLLRILTRKSMQQLVNEVDGIGNPKGDVYSVDQLRTLLVHFKDLKFQIRLILGWMVLPLLGKFIPDFILKPFQNKWGWFLYGRGEKF